MIRGDGAGLPAAWRVASGTRPAGRGLRSAPRVRHHARIGNAGVFLFPAESDSRLAIVARKLFSGIVSQQFRQQVIEVEARSPPEAAFILDAFIDDAFTDEASECGAGMV